MVNGWWWFMWCLEGAYCAFAKKKKLISTGLDTALENSLPKSQNLWVLRSAWSFRSFVWCLHTQLHGALSLLNMLSRPPWEQDLQFSWHTGDGFGTLSITTVSMCHWKSPGVQHMNLGHVQHMNHWRVWVISKLSQSWIWIHVTGRNLTLLTPSATWPIQISPVESTWTSPVHFLRLREQGLNGLRLRDCSLFWGLTQ